MIAVINTGGKQYLVREGDKLQVEKLELEVGQTVSFDPLLVTGIDAKDIKIGTPSVAGAKVTAKVLDHGRDKKVHIIKFKSKVRYRRNVGHRQPFTTLQIEKIIA